LFRLSSPGRAGGVHVTLSVAGCFACGKCRQQMARVYGEPVEVQTREDGRPTRFVWRGRLYAVREIQEYWVVNRDWWRDSSPVPAQPELQFWQVAAATGAGQPVGVYELRRDVAVDSWTLRRISD
jgi:Domain of unknown function (DUF6504)